MQENTQPVQDPWYKSAATWAVVLISLLGAVVGYGVLQNRVSNVETRQSEASQTYVTKDSFKGMADKIDDINQRQIRMEEKLDKIPNGSRSDR